MHLSTFPLHAGAEDKSDLGTQTCHEVVIVIVGFRNAGDVTSCVSALARATAVPEFDILICENGGLDAYEELSRSLLAVRDPAR